VDHDPPINAFYVAEMAGTRHYAQLFIGCHGGLTNFLPRLALNHDPPDLCLLISWDYRCGLQCPVIIFIFLLLFFLKKEHKTPGKSSIKED
jgi:hypothetical protein